MVKFPYYPIFGINIRLSIKLEYKSSLDFFGLFNPLYVVNLIRLLFVTEMTRGGGENFWWSHDIVGNIMLMVVGLGLFFMFIRVSSSS